jgi:hypothetical protein
MNERRRNDCEFCKRFLLSHELYTTHRSSLLVTLKFGNTSFLHFVNQWVKPDMNENWLTLQYSVCVCSNTCKSTDSIEVPKIDKMSVCTNVIKFVNFRYCINFWSQITAEFSIIVRLHLRLSQQQEFCITSFQPFNTFYNMLFKWSTILC